LNTADRNIVIHDTGVWLPQSKTWIYSQITNLGEAWEAWVIANRTENLKEFPYQNIYSLRDQHGMIRWFLELTLRRFGIAHQSPTLCRFVRKKRPTIIHSHFGTLGWYNLNMARVTSARHIVSFYGFDVTRVPLDPTWRQRYQNLFTKVDRVLCEGPHMGRQIEKLGCPAEKISVFRLGVNLSKLPFRPRIRQSDEPFKILIAATFVEKKGLPYAIEAIHGLRSQRPGLAVQATIVGDASRATGSNILKKTLHESITNLGMADIFRFTGFCNHSMLIELGDNHDIFLSPSVTAADGDTEGGAPVTIIEMAALGMPIVSTTHCDIPGILAPTNREMLVAERDSAALTRVLLKLADNPQDWAQLGRENREHIERHFDSRMQGRQLTKIYENVARHLQRETGDD